MDISGPLGLDAVRPTASRACTEYLIVRSHVDVRERERERETEKSESVLCLFVDVVRNLTLCVFNYGRMSHAILT